MIFTAELNEVQRGFGYVCMEGILTQPLAHRTVRIDKLDLNTTSQCWPKSHRCNISMPLLLLVGFISHMTLVRLVLNHNISRLGHLRHPRVEKKKKSSKGVTISQWSDYLISRKADQSG